MNELVMKKLGYYSNALTAFIVLQGIGYSYYLGSNEKFNCTVHKANYLAEALTILSFAMAMMALYAVWSIGKFEQRLAPEYTDILRKLTMGKVVVILVFGLIPSALTFFYAVLVPVPLYCL